MTRRDVLVLAVVLISILAAAPQPAGADEPRAWRDGSRPAVVDVLPPSGAIVGAAVRLQARLVAPADISSAALQLDGDVVAAQVRSAGRELVLRATATLAPGHHRARVVMVVDGQQVSRTWRFDVAPLQPRRIAGPDRLATAAAVARELTADDGPAGAAVLARADDGADALSGVGLAHALDGPLLLSPQDRLADATAEALRRTIAPDATVHVLGGPDALSDAVVDELGDLGFDVERVAGATRFETSVAVAVRAAAARGDDAGDRVVVASGRDAPDALAVSAPAAVRGWPVLLTEPDALPGPVRAYLASVGPSRVEVVGGPEAVAPETARAMAALAPVRRTGGIDRYATATLIADRFAGSPDGAALASGRTFADALAGAVLAARDDVALLLADDRLPEPAAAWLHGRSGGLTVLGGPAAVAHPVVTAALSAAVGGRPVGVDPSAGVVHDDDGRDLPPLRLRLPGADLLDESMASGWVDGEEARVRRAVDGDALHVTIVDLPRGVPDGSSVRLRLRATLRAADGRAGHVDRTVAVRLRPPLQPTPEGFLGVGGHGEVLGRAGTLHRYSLEVEPATGVDPHAFAAEAEAALSDPRGWTASGRVRLQRVPPADARIRVVLARPATVDRLCAQAGLRTAGIYSCWNGRVAALNLARWTSGAGGFDAPLSTYRAYLVNHEVGHGLGHGHRGCPSAGAPAPVMMQQTKGTAPCRPNAWPVP